MATGAGDRNIPLSMRTVAFGVITIFILWVLLFKGATLSDYESGSCHFPAIFNFGDSNSDTGSVSATFDRIFPPYGDTFFGKPSGRYSDGRLLIDFIAEELRFPYLSAYLDSIASNFQHGVNFAASGSTIQRMDAKLCAAGFNPLTLDVQISQFDQFKARTLELQDQAKSSDIKSKLPKSEDFARALYMTDSGQNDLHYGLALTTEEEVKKSIPNIIAQFTVAVEQLYEKGARAFWIHNTGPIGCLPYFVVKYPPSPDNADQNGCLKSYNEVAQEFDNQLKDSVSKLRDQHPDAVLIYVDLYSAKYSLISNAKDYGFLDPLGCCCGSGVVDCGKKTTVNGTETFGSVCKNPSEYISWDGIHYTEAANKWLAEHIVNGSFSEPRVSITEACTKPS
ncbi:hypothetical protein K7X08_030822 [Anisodus acutangulus]|uniref:Uncharacterized protein n=1 Tax=Anisodus acutangulus TaxID=402998 RepID=A0A9Q1M0W4_9SOLA|nr:hypothetical protein K7X08_030822 [Anisodus acutangulus]